ncbi:MAG: glycosyltransferase, partial [bacterium]
MKILHVTPTYLPATRYGGPIFSVHGLAKAQAALGHEVHIITTNVDGEQNSPVELDVDVSMDGVHVWYFPSISMRRLYYAPRMKSWLKQHIGEFDVLHLHSVYLWPTNMAARIAIKNNIPFTLAPRGMLVRELIQGRSAWIKIMWLRLIEQKTLSKARFIHYTTQVEQDQANMVGLTLAEGRIVANGIELPQLQSGIKVTRCCDFILYLGRISWKKGIDRLIESLVYVPELKLKIVGNDEEGYSEQLQQLV